MIRLRFHRLQLMENSMLLELDHIGFGTANVATADSLSQSRNIAATGDIAWN